MAGHELVTRLVTTLIDLAMPKCMDRARQVADLALDGLCKCPGQRKVVVPMGVAEPVAQHHALGDAKSSKTQGSVAAACHPDVEKWMAFEQRTPGCPGETNGRIAVEDSCPCVRLRPLGQRLVLLGGRHETWACHFCAHLTPVFNLVHPRQLDLFGMAHGVVQLDQGPCLQGLYRGSAPVATLKHDIAVHPGHVAALGRQLRQQQVQQPFLLPHQTAAAHTNHEVCLVVVQHEVRVGRPFDGRQRQVQMPPKGAVVRPPSLVAHWIEVTGDDPQTAIDRSDIAWGHTIAFPTRFAH